MSSVALYISRELPNPSSEPAFNSIKLNFYPETPVSLNSSERRLLSSKNILQFLEKDLPRRNIPPWSIRPMFSGPTEKVRLPCASH